MPPRKRPSKEPFAAREVAVLLEDLRSQFRTFGEGLEEIRGRLAGVEAEVRAFSDFTTFQKLVSERVRDDVSSLTAMGRKMTADIAAIRDDLRSIKSELKGFDTRLTAVEAKVGLP